MTDTAEAQPNSRKRFIFIALAVVLVIGIAGFGWRWWTHGRFMIETDDAYVQGDIALIASRVQGYVAEIPVADNQTVAEGDVIARIDDGDYRIALDTAQSRYDTADATLARIDAQTTAAEAAVQEAEADRNAARAQASTARTAAERARNLLAGNAGTQAQVDTANEGEATAAANLSRAEAAVASATAQVAVLRAQRAEAVGDQRQLQLAVRQAQRDLDLTVLRAPVDGTMANRAMQVGDLVSPGARLAAIVPAQSLYIEANFKETQLGDIRPGAQVHITFDALPDQEFTGTVASFAPATGAVFSLLPPDNATGNFTKVVQRVPVRIAIPDAALATGQLRAGLSAVVTVDRRTGG
ncbi:HlyD family secretion protein [Falsirhodobacter halotolerans]|uniref:HlyD family secretion protein n=1 Tax=Falsirhodobacter halotolerans TaxID=1146892 RepID=UPI001FD069DE|nr:HlyD family secretion protein [Falsirhodobacter halotolerans]MCJ8141158.1 HlyD family secretion protein [Falsirhodobacter halotolerans]